MYTFAACTIYLNAFLVKVSQSCYYQCGWVQSRGLACGMPGVQSQAKGKNSTTQLKYQLPR